MSRIFSGKPSAKALRAGATRVSRPRPTSARKSTTTSGPATCRAARNSWVDALGARGRHGGDVERGAQRQDVERRDQAGDDELVAVGGEQQHDRGQLVEALQLGALGLVAGVVGRGHLEAGEEVDAATRRTGSTANTSETRKPSAAPMRTCSSSWPTNAPTSVGSDGAAGARGDEQGQGQREHRLDGARDAAVGERRGDDEEGGHPDARQQHRLQTDPRQREGHGSATAEERRDPAEELLGEGDGLGDHPVAGDDAARPRRRSPWARSSGSPPGSG